VPVVAQLTATKRWSRRRSVRGPGAFRSRLRGGARGRPLPPSLSLRAPVAWAVQRGSVHGM